MNAGNRLAVALVVLLVFLSFSRAANGVNTLTDVNISPGETDNYYQASGRVWIPSSMGSLRGILILVRGTDSDARNLATRPEWQDFARNEHLALLACYFRGDGDPYEQASGGSGQALLSMIAQASDKLKLPALSRVPLLLIGHSSGAMFAYNFAAWQPARVAAFVSVKTGPIEFASNAGAAKVPALFIVGEYDRDRSWLAARVFLWQRAMRGCWAFAVESAKGHEWTGEDASFSRTYLHGVLVAANSISNANRSTRNSNKWQCRDLRFPERAVTAGNLSAANLVWLPDTDSVATWQRFTTAASVDDLASKAVSDPRNPSAFVNPSQIDLGTIDISGSSPDPGCYSGEVVLTGTGNVDWLFKASDPRLLVNANKIADNRYRLAIELRAAGLATEIYRGEVMAIPIKKTPGVQECTISVRARIRSSLTTIPSSLYVGALARGQKAERVIKLLSANQARQSGVLRVTSSRPQFASAQITTNGDSIICRFDGSKALGNQSGHFDITSSQTGAAARVTFIAFVLKTRSIEAQGQ